MLKFVNILLNTHWTNALEIVKESIDVCMSQMLS